MSYILNIENKLLKNKGYNIIKNYSDGNVVDDLNNDTNDNHEFEKDDYLFKDKIKLKKKKSLYKKIVIIFLPLLVMGSLCYIVAQQSKLRPNVPLKIGVCTIAKNENLYIREWVEYYKKIGVDKIFIYDNNDKNGEKMEDVIGDYNEDGFVDIIDIRGEVIPNHNYNDANSTQGKAFQDCYYSNYKNFDWLLLVDIDEFLSIDYKYKDINDFLNDFWKYDGVKIQWRMFGDNGHLHYENKPVFERFFNKSNIGYDKTIKSVVKCREYKYKLIFGPHGIYNDKPVMVNLKKQRIKGKGAIFDKKIHTDYPVYINHFYSKSTEEFIKRKFNKTDAYFGDNPSLEDIKKKYYQFNKVTDEKERMFNSLIE